MKHGELFSRGEGVSGSHVHVFVQVDWEMDPGELPSMSIQEGGGSYIRMGRPWSEWRLHRVRDHYDRKVARLQRGNALAVEAVRGSHRRNA